MFPGIWIEARLDGDGSGNYFDPENLHDLRLDTHARDPGEVIAQYKCDTRAKATNLPYRNDYIGRFTVRDGKVTCFAEYLDPTRFVIAIGGRVDPPPAP